jgi:exo-1,4-beta-D-glucosaminidase
MRPAMGRRIALGAVAALVSASMVSAAPAAQTSAGTGHGAGTGHRAGPAGHGAGPVPGGAAALEAARISLASASGSGASDLSNLGAGGWRVASSAIAGQAGGRISSPAYRPSRWLRVRNDDAGAPGTEIEALLQNGACPGVFFSANMRKCFGYEASVGQDTVRRFAVPWWWRTSFRARLRPGQAAALIVNGVVGSADVWLNGHRLASSGTVTGAYTRFTFGITPLLRPGANVVAIRVHPNDPNRMFTLDNVDWTQIPPDNNSGLQFPVQLQVAGPLADGNSRVIERNTADLSHSALTVRADLANTTGRRQSGTFTATITAPGAAGPAIVVSQAVTVPAHATRAVTLSPSRYPVLTIARPRVWWPYQMGSQPLYTLVTWVSQHGTVLNSTREQFGIRTVTSFLTGKSREAPDGVRVFAINGRRFVVRGGGFDPNLFLHYSASDITRQVALLRNLGLNTLRLEGHLMPEDFYRRMDRAGILINAGYQCCDAWQLPGNGQGVTAHDYRLLALSALTIGQQLRNHPSVFSFQWSDNQPTPKQERVSLAAFRQADFREPIISSAEYNSSPILGPSGQKEGPYDWVPPSYWYDTRHFDPGDSTRTNVGGSWGYDSEQSAGNTVPTLDSIRRFMSRRDQAELWRNPDFNQYHNNYEGTGHSGYAFGTLFNFDRALSARYGGWSSLASYVQKAQVQNYEVTRAQFEAFIDHSTNRPTPSTGTIYWQVNKGWPSLLWNLYNNDGDQAGSYFGTREANRSLHLLYAIDTGSVTLDNLGGARQSGLSVRARVYDLAGHLLDQREASGIALASQQVINNVLRPRVPAATVPPARARVYFVELALSRHGSVLDRNVYWLSTRQDVVNWRVLGNPQATMTRYANLRALNGLGRATVRLTAHSFLRRGPARADVVTRVTIRNVSRARTVAFFLRADLRRGTPGGTVLGGRSELQSALWSGNDITLWPGESQRLVVSYRLADLRGATPVISLSGWNLPALDVAAPLP